MSRHRPRRSPANRPEGYDIVRTPFGARAVPRGRGWAEAGKWAAFRILTQVIAWGAVAVLAWTVLTRLLAIVSRTAVR